MMVFFVFFNHMTPSSKIQKNRRHRVESSYVVPVICSAYCDNAGYFS